MPLLDQTTEVVRYGAFGQVSAYADTRKSTARDVRERGRWASSPPSGELYLPSENKPIMDTSQPQPSSRAHWRDYRIRRWSLGLFILFMVIFTLSQPFMPITWRRFFNSPVFTDIFGAVWLVGGLTLFLRLRGFLCPRCAKPFLWKREREEQFVRREREKAATGQWWSPLIRRPGQFFHCFARKCVHCDLPEYADADVKVEMTA